MDIYDVVKKLTGEIDPVGDSGIDSKRLENLKVACDLVNKLLIEIDYVNTYNKDSCESSRKTAAKYADEFFTRIGIAE